MNFLKMTAALVFITVFSSCTSQPGKYNCLSSNCYNNVDIPLDVAWQKSIEVLNSRWKISANDIVAKTLTVKTSYHDVLVQFTFLTANTCKFDVSSKDYYLLPNKAATKVVYLELNRALKNLEN
jgi:hypothetical protein